LRYDTLLEPMILLLIVILTLLLLFIGVPIFVVISGLALYLFSANQIDLSAVDAA